MRIKLTTAIKMTTNIITDILIACRLTSKLRFEEVAYIAPYGNSLTNSLYQPQLDTAQMYSK